MGRKMEFVGIVVRARGGLQHSVSTAARIIERNYTDTRTLVP